MYSVSTQTAIRPVNFADLSKFNDKLAAEVINLCGGEEIPLAELDGMTIHLTALGGAVNFIYCTVSHGNRRDSVLDVKGPLALLPHRWRVAAFYRLLAVKQANDNARRTQEHLRPRLVA